MPPTGRSRFTVKNVISRKFIDLSLSRRGERGDEVEKNYEIKAKSYNFIRIRTQL